MSTAPSVPSRPVASQRSRLANILLAVGCVVIFLLVMTVITLLFGRVSGEEFSPSDFKRRSFHFYELPIVGIQIWPMQRFDSTSDVESDLVANKLIVVSTPTTPRWDLVHGARGASLIEGDAAFLCHYFDLRSRTYTLAWGDWNNKHPELAKILWPMIQKLAEQELYSFMPDVFNLAETASDPTAFQSDLNMLVAQTYYDFGLYQQQNARHAAAVELIGEAMKLAPEKKDQWQPAFDLSQKEVPQAEAPPL